MQDSRRLLKIHSSVKARGADGFSRGVLEEDWAVAPLALGAGTSKEGGDVGYVEAASTLMEQLLLLFEATRGSFMRTTT